MSSNQFVSRVVQHPFRYYFRAASATFGITFISNTASAFIIQKPVYDPVKYPQQFAIACFMKSAYFGFLWPSVPFMLATRPNEFLVLGAVL